ncbi:hypothetical protein NtRootA4_41080 [Arthrobacter sp. NtRootA4]|nr:hypothetical protein NtRootA4_41080 [Arthrobacter sp. NtRootA4]BCW21353.1 hypothetical protein NtRootC7_02200 [Arthrobacter sp. NtRootC7]BCW25620.1 hypothetical protein NtRootC45_02200 [Arthrobacter sp. NtRootC45]BCW29889.1 hypothetical protein NtRootD5_02200 [Arthrobacter sp. NtRootD5]
MLTPPRMECWAVGSGFFAETPGAAPAGSTADAVRTAVVMRTTAALLLKDVLLGDPELRSDK